MPFTDENRFDPSTFMWFSAPAAKWDEALPVGNGRLGAMVFGTVLEERIQLNESTYWTGGPYSTVVKGGHEVLPELQKLVFEGKALEAHNLFGRKLMGYPVEQQKYQSLANLHLAFQPAGTVTEYSRDLDLATGTSHVSYKLGGIRYHRETFASYPDQAIVIHLTADQPGAISFKANLRGVRNQAHSNYGTDYFRMDAAGSNQLVVTGKSADYLGIPGKLKYEGRIQATHEGGSVKTVGTDLIVEGANSVTLVFVAATNFVNYKDVSGDCHKRVEADLARLSGKGFEALKHDAVQDYKGYFDRASLSLPSNKNSFLPTPERKVHYQSEADPSLAALTYNFGRYILISSSRPGGQPANLQGIWNDDMNPAWDSKYTTNINTEMNYWPAETANLGDLTEPLFRLIKEVSDQGSKVAKEHYGAHGWVFHQNTDLWRVAAPMDGPSWGTFTVGGAWLCTHLWEHYAYTGDKAFLKSSLPLLEGSVLFFLDFLVQQPNGKWMVTNPSTSPENFPNGGNNGPFFDETTGSMQPGTTICAGSSIDMEILYDLFGYYLAAVNELGIHSNVADRVKEVREKLVPPQIGKDGSLQEWSEDWKSLEKNHRHFSHLYGLYPGRVLVEKQTPALVKAYKQVLEERGDGGMGFSMAWKMALWARLGDGNRSNKIFKNYLKDQSCIQMFALCGKALQVDGTLGATAALTEMLIQSHEGNIHLLPALPSDWASGQFKGVCTRGGFIVDFDWADGHTQSAKIMSKNGGLCRIKVKGEAAVIVAGEPVATKINSNGTFEFPTEKNKSYILKFLAHAK